MSLTGNTDETNGYNSVIKNGETNNANHVKGVISPIGAILAWHKTFTNTPALTDAWVECNGQVLSDADSPYNGQTIPNLNTGTYKILRGAATSGGTGGADTHTLTVAELPSHRHTIDNAATTDSYGTGGVTAATGASGNTGYTGSGDAHNNIPAYFEVVWIMRVK
jgi:microcystin-dependent protein